MFRVIPIKRLAVGHFESVYQILCGRASTVPVFEADRQIQSFERVACTIAAFEDELRRTKDVISPIHIVKRIYINIWQRVPILFDNIISSFGGFFPFAFLTGRIV